MTQPTDGESRSGARLATWANWLHRRLPMLEPADGSDNPTIGRGGKRLLVASVSAPSSLTVLVDPSIPDIAECAELLLGSDAVKQLAMGDATTLATAATPTIVHLLYGSELSAAFGKNVHANQAVRVLVHGADVSSLSGDDRIAPQATIRLGDALLILGAEANSSFDNRLSSRWESAAALGRLYLRVGGLGSSASRFVAMAIAAMDVVAASSQTRAPPTGIGLFDARVDHALLGIPCVTVAPNAAYSRPYLADRAGLRLTIRSNGYLFEQPISFWPHREDSGGRVLLPQQQPLENGEKLDILDDRLVDLAVGTPMVAVRRLKTGTDGYLTLDALITKGEGDEGDIWVGDHPDALRRLVEFQTDAGTIYSPNFTGTREREESTAFLSRFLDPSDDLSRDPPHPLQVGAHAHRLGVWALDAKRDPAERASVARLFAATFDRYLAPKAVEVAPGAISWPYEFDFRMPWATALPAPWFGGYANATLVGTLAVGWALSAEARWKDLARGAVGYLNLPSEKGGAAYRIGGFQFIAEYAYRTPPIPNYRVLDGELCSPPYLHNAGLLLDDPELVVLAHRLACSLITPLRLLCRSDGAPLFGMDGQDMNPNYMLQLWMCMQLLAAMTKDRTFAKIARDWKRFIPESFWADGYPK